MQRVSSEVISSNCGSQTTANNFKSKVQREEMLLVLLIVIIFLYVQLYRHGLVIFADTYVARRCEAGAKRA